MKCLSVRQPHATRIASGEKDLEIRSKATKYRGAILICAAMKADSEAMPPNVAMVAGVACCIVDIIGCRLMTPQDTTRACIPFRPGHFAWVLSNPRPVPSVSVKGQLGIFQRDLPEL